MFDVGFSELAVIGVVALVVIGPEKLPRVARTAGLLWGRMQRQVAEVKADIHRELELEEMKRLRAEVTESARAFEQSIRDEAQEVRAALDPVAAEPPLAAPEPEPAPAVESAPVETSPALAALAVPVPPVLPQLALGLEEEARPVVDDSQLDLFGQPLSPPPHEPAPR